LGFPKKFFEDDIKEWNLPLLKRQLIAAWQSLL